MWKWVRTVIPHDRERAEDLPNTSLCYTAVRRLTSRNRNRKEQQRAKQKGKEDRKWVKMMEQKVKIKRRGTRLEGVGGE